MSGENFYVFLDFAKHSDFLEAMNSDLKAIFQAMAVKNIPQVKCYKLLMRKLQDCVLWKHITREKNLSYRWALWKGKESVWNRKVLKNPDIVVYISVPSTQQLEAGESSLFFLRQFLSTGWVQNNHGYTKKPCLKKQWKVFPPPSILQHPTAAFRLCDPRRWFPTRRDEVIKVATNLVGLHEQIQS